VLADGKQKFALADIDGLSEGRGVEEAVRRAAGLTGIPVEHIRAGWSHTHS